MPQEMSRKKKIISRVIGILVVLAVLYFVFTQVLKMSAGYSTPYRVEYSVEYGRTITTHDENSSFALVCPPGWVATGSTRTETRYGQQFAVWEFHTPGTYTVSARVQGEATLKLFESGHMTVAEAKAAQPNFLGDQHVTLVGENLWLIMPSNSTIKNLAAEICGNSTDNQEVISCAEKIFRWIKERIEHEEGPTVPKIPTEVLSTGTGDCDELSCLFISLCRAAGIPARLVSGFRYNPTTGSGSGHGWAEIFARDNEGNPTWMQIEMAISSSADEAIACDFCVFHPGNIPLYFDYEGTDNSLQMYSVLGWSTYTSSPLEWGAPITHVSGVHETAKIVYEDGNRKIEA